MVTTDYVYSQSIVNESGVSPGERMYDGVILKSKGDFVTYRGMPEISPGTYGSILRVTHIWESGDISKLPEDYVLELRPTDMQKVINLEKTDGRPEYNVRVDAIGPLYEEGIYRGYQTSEPPPEETTTSNRRIFNGPGLTILSRFPILSRLLSRGN